jgi:hypothetical protein
MSKQLDCFALSSTSQEKDATCSAQRADVMGWSDVDCRALVAGAVAQRAAPRPHASRMIGRPPWVQRRKVPSATANRGNPSTYVRASSSYLAKTVLTAKPRVTMPRIPRVRGLASLPLTASRSPFLAATRSISSTSPARALGDKLWKKGENPLPEDPYTQRAEPQETSGLPEETRPARVRIPNAVRNSRLALPPKRSEATPEKELSNVDPTYVPATSLEELEQIDTLKTWWEQPGHWGEESTFKGFALSEKLVDPNVVELYLRRVVVEVLALRQTGKFSELATKSWSEGTRADLDAALAIQIDAKDGGASLKGDALAVAEQVAGETEGAETPERISAEEAAELVQSWDPSWKSLSLDDEVRFAVSSATYCRTIRKCH